MKFFYDMELKQPVSGTPRYFLMLVPICAERQWANGIDYNMLTPQI